MSFLTSIARGILKLDARLSNSIGNAFYQRSLSMRADVEQRVQDAEAKLTAGLATITKDHARELARAVRVLAERKDDATDKAYARRDIDVQSAHEDSAIADNLAGTAIEFHANCDKALAALDALK